MPPAFEELDYAHTPMGALSLRRRTLPGSDEDVFEVKLGEDFLMSSRFTAGEVALAELALAECAAEAPEVLVGGLGLGHTAAAALDTSRVRALVVIEALAPVIDWHRRALVPLGARLAGDPRCRMVRGDFFALAANPAGFDPDAPNRRFDAVLLDVDHSPRHVLSPAHAAFYAPEGLARLRAHLRPGGLFALWSNDPPDAAFARSLAGVFATAEARVVSFPNPLQDREAANTVYLARAPGRS